MTSLSQLARTIIIATLSLSSVYAQSGPNLIQDASFESGLHPWLAEHTNNGGQEYYIGYLKTKDASEGNFVLDVQGWNNVGWSRILSPEIAMRATTYGATIKARCMGANPVKVELAVYSAKDGYNAKKKLASFVSQTLKPDGKWATLSGTATLPAGTESGDFAIVVTGSSRDTHLELDQAGLFAGGTIGPVTNNVETLSWPAESLANDKGWNKIEDFFYDRAIGTKEIWNAGAHVSASGKAVAKGEIAQAGPHTLWVRCSRTASSSLTIELRQEGKVVASRDVREDEPEVTPTESAGWVSLQANLSQGPVEVALGSSTGNGSERRIDYLVLSNYPGYVPTPQEYRPQGYIRFTNRSKDPYGLWVRGILGGYGILTRAGFLPGGIGVSKDQDTWIQPGESTPWLRVTDKMPKYDSQFGILATVGSYTKGFYTGRFVGDLDFAYGDDHTITKTVHIDQAGPRLLMTIPYDFKNQPEKFLTGLDHLKDSTAVTDPMPAVKLGKRILILAGLNLNARMDDPELVEGEIGVIKKLGMNSLYDPAMNPEENKAFLEAHGLVPFIRLWAPSLYYLPGTMKADPDLKKIEPIAAEVAKNYANALDQVNIINIADEPYGEHWFELLKSPDAREKFLAWLHDSGITLEQLGLNSWDEADIVGPAHKKDNPILFYYSGLYRLQIFNDEITTDTALWHTHFPKTAQVYVNLEPTYSTTADQIGYDLFGLIRTGGPDLIWSEDWSGYGASIQETSDYMALLTSINRTAHKPLGGYCVAVELVHQNPLLARIKAYNWLAAGATMLDFYNYGPEYCAGDAWSYAHELYPAIASVGADTARFEDAMEGLKPRHSPVAILYNRTAGIWDDYASSTEADSRYMLWALSDCGYCPEIVCEDEVDEGILSHYKVLYLNGVELRGQTAKNIAQWVHEGGTLVGAAGAGSEDEFAKPQSVLDSVFGVKSGSLGLEPSDSKVPDIVTTTPAYPNPELKIERLNVTEKLTLLPSSDAKPLLTATTGETAGVLNTFGSGKAIRLAFLPGVTFLHEATSGKKFETHLPQEYRTEVARFISWPATLAGVPQVGQASSSAPLATLKRWDLDESATPGRSIVFVIDYAGKPNPDFSMTLPDAAHFTHIRTAHEAKVTVTPAANGLTRIAFPLDAADAVILEK